MEYLELRPSPPLDSIVHCFWFLRGQLDGAPPQPVVPDGRPEIVLHLAEPFAQIGVDGVTRRQREALFSGQLTTAIRLAPQGTTDIVGIRFRTAAARALIGAPIDEFTDRLQPLAGLAPTLRGALLDATRADDPRARSASLERTLSRFVAREPRLDIIAAVRALDRLDPPRVSTVARWLGISRRSLERRMVAETGLSPWMLQRILRFRRVFRMLGDAPPGTMTEAAAAAGYFDQSHLIRDFREFAGASPSEFFGGDPALARAMAADVVS